MKIPLVQVLVALCLFALGMQLKADEPPAPEKRHDPAQAVSQLDTHPALRTSLFASEPMMRNPTNIDIDHLGRVWVCEVVNYRRFRNTELPEREQGDRILVLEDTDGDGAADKSSTFYQGHDVDSAHGICVLGNRSGKATRALVSAQDSVFFLIDDDGDLKCDRKQVLFTGIGGVEHDHGIHAFVFGPDGKLYFNFGNEGKQIRDQDGELIVDQAGNPVQDDRQPYQQGMVFRCNLDGSQLETLGWNFRNSWEVCVDSFGTLWQSDNDDDGNRGTRINFVMEFGNYGYRDEKTGATWREERTGMHDEIPKRHWHLNDPGVVPNLLQTGAGSPTGILVYEGQLLPQPLRHQLIHCDAGPNAVRCYPVEKKGAAYTADVVKVLDGSSNPWFRPSDVCVAPDGSLLVADWYDPGVGGHRMEDINRGRLFRVIPEGHDGRYTAPLHDFSTAEGAVEALQSPNLATRYVAWTVLHEMGQEAEPALEQLYESDQPRRSARALWLLGKIPGRGEHYVGKAIGDDKADLRITGVRLARQLNVDILPIVQQLVHDPSAQVRRELAIALRHHEAPQAAELWAELALQHDGCDRWYLEALGIGADRQWDRFLDAWLDRVGQDWSTPAGRDILWRSRAKQTPSYLAKILTDPETPVEEQPRYFRAFDFLSGPEKQESLKRIAQRGARQVVKNARVVQALLRLDGVDVSDSPRLKSAVLRHLETKKGTRKYVDLVRQLDVRGVEQELLRMAIDAPSETAGVEAATLLLSRDQTDLFRQIINGEDPEAAVDAVTALGHVGNRQASALLRPLVLDAQRSRDLRVAAAEALGRSRVGQRYLLKLAQTDRLPADLHFTVANALYASQDPEIRDQISNYLSLPAAAGSTPVPPVVELVQTSGDAERGKELFQTAATCAKCHKVRGQGKEVGPDLSEIGSKLSRHELFVSILDPNAGVSHNYERYSVILDSGNIESGVLVSRTDEMVTLRTADAIDKTFRSEEIDEMVQSEVSLMPADLQKNLSVQDLVDVVQYMTTLKKSDAGCQRQEENLLKGLTKPASSSRLARGEWRF